MQTDHGGAGRLVFRADASPRIGGGHVMRCLALADILTKYGAQCWFASTAETVETVPALADSAHRILILEAPGHAANVQTAMTTAGLSSCDWLVSDHYGWDASQESACRSFTAKILAIDDLADRPHDCDMLLDQTLGRDPSDYEKLTPAHCRKLIGPLFALLRPEFPAARAEALAKRQGGEIRRILVSMGLTDPSNATSRVLEGISKSGLPAQVDVVLGSSAPHLESIRQMAESSESKIAVHENPPSMAALMMKADLAFGAGGSSSWERCCLGLPSVMAILADNQKEVVAGLAAASAVIALDGFKGIDANEVNAILKDLSQHPGRLAALGPAAAAICDGRGAYRVQMILDPAMTKDGAEVWLRPASSGDGDLLYEWQSESGSRRFARNPEVPSLQSHYIWFEGRLRDPATLLNIIVINDRPGGVLRLDYVEANMFEISILIASAFRGKGIADAALVCAARLVPEATLRAEVLAGNAASEALFTRAGYRPSGYGVKYRPACGTH